MDLSRQQYLLFLFFIAGGCRIPWQELPRYIAIYNSVPIPGSLSLSVL